MKPVLDYIKKEMHLLYQLLQIYKDCIIRRNCITDASSIERRQGITDFKNCSTVEIPPSWYVLEIDPIHPSWKKKHGQSSIFEACVSLSPGKKTKIYEGCHAIIYHRRGDGYREVCN